MLLHGLGGSGADWALQLTLEMTVERPSAVPRLGLINSLATYRPEGFALARRTVIDRLHSVSSRTLLIAAAMQRVYT